MKDNRLQYILKICFLVAIEFIFCFTPLGSIPIGPIVATLSAVPVIITSIVFGAGGGMILGLLFGIFSFIYWTFLMPAAPTAFLFTPFSEFTELKGSVGSIIICFAPRMLIGLTPAIVMNFGRKDDSDYRGSVRVYDIRVQQHSTLKVQSDLGVNCESAKTGIGRIVLASVVGSLTNTILVMFFIFLFFRHEYETLMGQNILILISATILTNGIPEAIIAGIVCPFVSKAIKAL